LRLQRAICALSGNADRLRIGVPMSGWFRPRSCVYGAGRGPLHYWFTADYCSVIQSRSSTFSANVFFATTGYTAAPMPPRVDKLLAELKAWCDQEWGRRAKVAKMLGIERSALSDWFNPKSSRLPTAEQALEIQAFLRAQRRRRPSDPPAS
jgi:predicted XRE-type DNA-binding protein